MNGATCTTRRVAVEAGHLADAIDEAVPVGLRQVVDLVHAQVHAAGGDLVQQRLPEVRALPVDQRDAGLAALAELVAQAGGKLEPAGAAADNDDAFRGSAFTRYWSSQTSARSWLAKWVGRIFQPFICGTCATRRLYQITGTLLASVMIMRCSSRGELLLRRPRLAPR